VTAVADALLRAARAAARLPARAVIGVLRLWQLVVSPVYGQTCRFYPSCTAYAVEAVTLHGLVRGGWLVVRRLGRCHPWNPGGVDLVPARKDRAVTIPTADADASAAGGPMNTTAADVADHRPPRRAA
jgi:hypothetical protein